MINFKSILLASSLLLTLITNSLGYSAKNQISEDETLIFVRVYESGWVKATRGVYVFYPDGKRDKTDISDELDPIGNAQKIYDALTKVSKMGYSILNINKCHGTGVNDDNYYIEYIFISNNAKNLYLLGGGKGNDW